MIIWIDGPFGVGKSTVSRVLSKKIKNSLVIEFDEYFNKVMPANEFEILFGPVYPEGKKYLIKKLIEDLDRLIQDDPEKTVIVPIAMFNDLCRIHLVNRFSDICRTKHFILLAKKETVFARANEQKGRDFELVKSFYEDANRYYQVEYIDAIRVDTEKLSVKEIVKFICDNI